MKNLLWFCFLLSGSAALALEVLWIRSAGLVLGTTAITAATVLGCYFAGLGAGSAWARGVSSRPVRLYGCLELAASAGALWSVAVFWLMGHDAAQTWIFMLGTAARVLTVALAILPATICLGATLPTLGQALATNESLGRRGGFLYAINTVGSVLGAAAAGFGLPLWVGVHTSYGIAAAASAGAGILAILISRRDAKATEPESQAEREPLSTQRVRLRIVAGGAGALALALEVLWTHFFAQVLHNSVYSFTAIVLVFLTAIAFGAIVAALLLPRASAYIVAGTALLLAGSVSIGGLWFFLYWTAGLTYFGMRSGLIEYLVRIVLLAACTAGPAAVLSGMVLPALWTAWGERINPARPLGDLSAANLFGGVLGAAVTGFFIIPTLGIRGSFLLIAIGYLVLADVLTPTPTRLRSIAYVILLVVIIANPLRVPLVHLNSPSEILRDTIEGATGVVSVIDSGGDRQLRLDNYYELGDSAAAANERRQGLLPLLLHPNPHHAAFIGLATGITASAGPALGTEQTTVVELVPAVATAARLYFARWNANLLKRSDIRLVLDDGRHYLTTTDRHFDVIVSDLFVPWNPGTGNLYTQEMFQTAARRLAPGGIFCQWLPLYQLRREEFDIIVHTFLTVFPHVSLWRDDFYADLPVVGLVGQLTAKPLDLVRTRERLRRLPVWSNDPLFATPRGLFMLYAGNLRAVADLFSSAPVNTDNYPVIEFLAPRLTRVAATFGNADWFTGKSLASFYDTLDRRLVGVSDPLLPASKDITAAWRAGTALYHYTVAAATHDDASATRYQAEVRALVPEVVSATVSGNPNEKIEISTQELSVLLKEQEALQHQLEEMQRRLNWLSTSEKNAQNGQQRRQTVQHKNGR